MSGEESAGTAGHATGGVRMVLQTEGALLLLAMLVLFHQIGGDWWMFALLFFVPDLSLTAYLGGPRLGAFVYNLAHSTILPLGLGIAAFAAQRLDLLPFAMIWIAHIGFDRMLGFGLKYGSAFGDTHLLRMQRRG